MTAIDSIPGGVDLLAIRIGGTLERWGRARAERRAQRAAAVPYSDPREAERMRIELEAARAASAALVMRIR